MKNEERSQGRGTVRSRTVATTVLMVATFMDLMDSTITNVALPTIGKDLGATPEQLDGPWPVTSSRSRHCSSRAVDWATSSGTGASS